MPFSTFSAEWASSSSVAVPAERGTYADGDAWKSKAPILSEPDSSR